MMIYEYLETNHWYVWHVFWICCAVARKIILGLAVEQPKTVEKRTIIGAEISDHCLSKFKKIHIEQKPSDAPIRITSGNLFHLPIEVNGPFSSLIYRT